MTVRILVGDCLVRLKELPDASVHAIVTDPPAGIAFMSKAWDEDKGGRDEWIKWLASVMREAYRVAKPGAHALVWALPRTSHWTAMALEDAGFEIRDSLHHVFGSGFPKALDVSKAIDSVDGVAMTREATLRFTAWMRSTGITAAQIAAATDTFMASHYLSANEQPAIPTPDLMDKLRPLLPAVPEWVETLVEARRIGSENSKKREVLGERVAADFLNSRPVSAAAQGVDKIGRRVIQDTTGYTSDAAKWEGWKTALKPAHEVWWLARKPIDGSVAANVLEHGCGALNIDGSRIPAAEGDRTEYGIDGDEPASIGYGGSDAKRTPYERPEEGRYPPNLLLSHGEECVDGAKCAGGCPVAEMDRQSGESESASGPQQITRRSQSVALDTGMGKAGASFSFEGYGDAGGASRFFPVFRYEAKPSRGEREAGLREAGLKEETIGSMAGGGEEADDPVSERFTKTARNVHPTVKSVALMSWLCKLVTPPGGTVLDCFGGSGSTGVAAQRLGFDAILVEREAEYVRIAEARIRGDQPLFSRVTVE